MCMATYRDRRADSVVAAEGGAWLEPNQLRHGPASHTLIVETPEAPLRRVEQSRQRMREP